MLRKEGEDLVAADRLGGILDEHVVDLLPPRATALPAIAPRKRREDGVGEGEALVAPLEPGRSRVLETAEAAARHEGLPDAVEERFETLDVVDRAEAEDGREGPGARARAFMSAAWKVRSTRPLRAASRAAAATTGADTSKAWNRRCGRRPASSISLVAAPQPTERMRSPACVRGRNASATMPARVSVLPTARMAIHAIRVAWLMKSSWAWSTRPSCRLRQ